MSLTNPNTPVSQQDLQDFYHKIVPYMGGSSGGGSGGGHTIEDAEGVDLPQRDTLQFGEGFATEDDYVNEKTVVTPNLMPSEDMSEVVSPLPSKPAKYPKYSTEEQIVAEWIDGKPVYQKTVYNTTLSSIPNNNWVTYCTIENLKDLILFKFIRANNDGGTLGVFNDICGSTNGSNVTCISRTTALTLDYSKSYATLQYTKTTD